MEIRKSRSGHTPKVRRKATCFSSEEGKWLEADKSFRVASQKVWHMSLGAVYRLEEMAYLPRVNKIMTLGLVPSEIIIQSGAVMAVLPQDTALEDVNKCER